MIVVRQPRLHLAKQQGKQEYLNFFPMFCYHFNLRLIKSVAEHINKCVVLFACIIADLYIFMYFQEEANNSGKNGINMP